MSEIKAKYNVMRTCTKCGETKPLEEFSLSRRGETVRRSECKACDHKYHLRRKARRLSKAK